METTHAYTWTGKNRIERLELPMPQTPPGGLLLEVTANGICGTDQHLISREPRRPTVLGHEIVGRVVSFGAGHPQRDADDRPLREGDTVALFPWVPCHTCWACRRFGPGAATCTEAFVYGIPLEDIGLEGGVTSMSGDGPALTGGLGRHIAVQAGTYLWRVPEHVPTTVASLLDPLGVAVRAVDLARTNSGSWDETLTSDATAVVLGAGAVGLLTAMVLRHVGVGKVVVSGSRPGRIQAARDVGVDVVLDTAGSDAATRRKAVLDLTQGRGADLVIDAASRPAALSEALGMVRRLGTVIEVGNIVPGDHGITIDPALDVCQRNIRLIGMSFNPPRSYAEGMALLTQHDKIPFERLITHAHPFTAIDRALEDLTGDDTVKVTLTV
ncbi:zinc-binding dehydrogenase [Streptomyces sp. TRM72054]|uniref:zinc-dependent alcohol dehydrogenase n=1 Tax=Streptomyces sp. TRM72054 TaxID=2870562 RepID=UPI001C8B5BD7|nr:zinc-binding dehydrogenase [Streptomyces sp. TRM72054]MBX9394398.1 zinc-binding dehydrogenase [Streptomyces sp. TRM72054]